MGNTVKAAVFEEENLLEVGPNLQKSQKIVKSAVLWGVGKSLDMSGDFRPRATHPIKK